MERSEVVSPSGGARLNALPRETLSARGAQLMTLLGRLVREPLVHFIAIGLLLVVAGEWYREATDPYRIVITPDQVAKIALDYQLQYGVTPARVQLDGLVARYIDDEVLFRQGLALKLDQGDEIVRRRVIQKMQFIEQGLTAPAEPSDAELSKYYRAHAAHYMVPERVTFTHIYFSPDRGGDAAARARAATTLASLGSATRAPERGDAFPDLYDYAGFGPEQVSRLFGHSEFANAIFAAPVGRWSGPYRSGYGWHLVYVQAHAKAVLPPLASIRDTVHADYLQDEQDRNNKQAFADLKHRFTIERNYKLSP